VDRKILDAIDELAGENKQFIREYLEWANTVPGTTLQLDRPLVRILKEDHVVAVLELTTALLTLPGVEEA